MKLLQINENLHDIFRGSISLRSHDTADSTNQLVAYRLNFGNRAGNCWGVELNNQHLANILRQDSRWVHDNWTFAYRTKYDSDVSPNFQQIMTKQNRPYLDEMLEQLIRLIKRAITARQADIVILPIDPNKL